jgi:hypothetical protein
MVAVSVLLSVVVGIAVHVLTATMPRATALVLARPVGTDSTKSAEGAKPPPNSLATQASW